MGMSADRRARRIPQGERSAPAAVLDPSHPLAGALEERRREIDRVMVSVAVLVGAGGATLTGSAAPWLSIAAAAAAAVSVFGARLAFVRDRIRSGARQAVIDGRDDLPLRCVRAERARLADPAHHEHLAAWTEALARVYEAGPAPPLWSLRILRAAAPELRELAHLVRTGHTGIRGVAMLDQLLSRGALPLYGNDARALVEQLGRIRFHLRAGA